MRGRTGRRGEPCGRGTSEYIELVPVVWFNVGEYLESMLSR